MCTLLEKKTSVRVFGLNKLSCILKGFLRLDLQPVQLIFPTSITDKKSTSPPRILLADTRRQLFVLNLYAPAAVGPPRELSWWIWVLVKYPALVLHYLEAGCHNLQGRTKLTTGNTCTQVQCRCINLYCSNSPPYSGGCAAAAGAFLCISYRGKLLQHKLIRVQCTKKSTRVPVSPVPQYGYSV